MLKFNLSFEYSISTGRIPVGLRDLLDYVSRVFNNVEKYQDAISLVVTKVPSNLNDAQVIKSIELSLLESKQRLEVLLEREKGKGTKIKEIKKKIQFVKIFLKDDQLKLTKIGIFRVPDKEELLATKIMPGERKSMLEMVGKLTYASKKEKDFNIVKSSYQGISSLISGISERISENFEKVNMEIQNFILEEESRHSRNLENALKTTKMIEKKLLLVNSNEPKKFQEQVVSTMDDMEISTSSSELPNFIKYTRFMDMLCNVDEDNCKISSKVFNEFKNSKTLIGNSLDWYRFVVNLREKLATYDIQERSNEINGQELMDLSEMHETEESIPNEGDAADSIKYKKAFSENWEKGTMMIIKSTIDHVIPNFSKEIENLHVNKYKLYLLQAVWNQSLQHPTYDAKYDECPPGKESLSVKGYNILLSNVTKHSCFRSVKHIQIFALNKVFIDSNITKSSINQEPVDIAIISPIWEIVHYTEMDLSGTNAMTINPAGNRARGEDGNPGNPGGPGGQFFAIGRFITGEAIVNVSLKGGAGGDGQVGQQG